MEPWPSDNDRPTYDRPYLRSARSPAGWLSALLAVLVLGAAGYWYLTRPAPQPAAALPEPFAEPAAAPTPVPAAVAPSAPPEVRHPIATPPPPAAAPAPSLPALERSDSALRSALARLLGKWPSKLLYADRIVRRIVATVDNLPRHAAAARMMPLRPVPGRFGTERSGEEIVLDPASFARYAPYVALVRGIDARALVDLYVSLYPLFQQAYQDLGYPQGYFNDRLLEAIDDLLAAPELTEPPKLVQPRILYEYADPELEMRSAGQKILMRMGAANAAAVKAKLREIRQELLAAAARSR